MTNRGDFQYFGSSNSEFYWFEQKRARGVLAATSQGNVRTETDYSSGNPGLTTSISTLTLGDYFYQGAYQPIGTSARWAGDDFDMLVGSVIYSGTSNYNHDHNHSSSGVFFHNCKSYCYRYRTMVGELN